MKQYTEKQLEVLNKIEVLRIHKQNLKDAIGRLEVNIVQIDLTIRDLRQSIPSLEPVEVPKPRNTQVAKLARLEKELEELRAIADKRGIKLE